MQVPDGRDFNFLQFSERERAYMIFFLDARFGERLIRIPYKLWRFLSPYYFIIIIYDDNNINYYYCSK